MKRIACIVLPTYNEAENLRVLLPRIFAQQEWIPSYELHVLVVEDNSPDGSGQVVENCRTRFPFLHIIRGEKKGLGEAYKRGIRHAMTLLNPELVITMDADLQHDPSLLPHMIGASDQGYSVVIGSRYVDGAQVLSFSGWRVLLSHTGNSLVRWAGGLKIQDCTSGYRTIRSDLLLTCDLEYLSTRGYSFLSALLCQLVWNGARVIEIPITFGVRGHGKSKLSVRDQAEFLGRVMRIFLLRKRYRGAVVNPSMRSGTAEMILNITPDLQSDSVENKKSQ
jgi:dolichol-phosphate mannosyltransferase